MGPRRPKNQTSQNGFKKGVCVGLVNINPTQLERAQTDIVCKRYHGMFAWTNKQKNYDCTICTVLTW
jgi:hypothetical protein